ncbi:MAG TPA: redoxin domain-containing protein, partial [Candidatus Polarisedimenticolia bacterium]|nr:redoxin domain-containing protein [Candidatus Polarisedimenticolia bacterium]
AMMPRNPDFLWLRASALSSDYEHPEHVEEAIKFVDDHRHEVENPADLLVVKAGAQEFLGSQVHNDPQRVAAALATLEEARRIDPTNYKAHSLAGLYLSRGGEPEKALPLLERAIKLAPDTIPAHVEYWQAVANLDPSQQASRREAVVKDMGAVVARSADFPWALWRAARAYGKLGLPDKQRDLEELLLRSYPDSGWEDAVVSDRLARIAQSLDLWNRDRGKPPQEGPAVNLAVEEIHPTPESLDREMGGGFKEFLWKYVEKPHPDNGPAQGYTLGYAYMVLFEMARSDPGYDEKKLEQLVRGLVDHGDATQGSDTRGLNELASRRIALDRTEQMARAALEQAEKKLAEKSRDPNAIYLDSARGHVARLHDALGWVLLRQGRIEAAEKELKMAHEMSPGDRENLYHRAELALARGERARAEDLLAECGLIPPRSDNPCTPALEDLYRRDHTDMTGYDRYAKAVFAKGRALKRERLLATRIQPARAILPFRFKSLDGPGFSSEDLKGRVAVIDFWGIWCGSCVAAMPDFQKLADKYRNDPDVAIVAIDTFDPAPKLEKWLKRNGITVPVLLESDYVDKAKIESYPTTWFLNRQGLLSYARIGDAEDLIEENSWIIEELKRDRRE